MRKKRAKISLVIAGVCTVGIIACMATLYLRPWDTYLWNEKNEHPDGVLSTENGLKIGYSDECDVYEPESTMTDAEYEFEAKDWSSGLMYLDGKLIGPNPSLDDFLELDYKVDEDESDAYLYVLTKDGKDGVIELELNDFGNIYRVRSKGSENTFVKDVKPSPSRRHVKTVMGEPEYLIRDVVNNITYSYSELHDMYCVEYRFDESENKLISVTYSWYAVMREEDSDGDGKPEPYEDPYGKKEETTHIMDTSRYDELMREEKKKEERNNE